MSKKVMLGMSGGVDSSVAAIILQNRGYEVTGATMRLQPDKYVQNIESASCAINNTDIEDARHVAYKLGIEHIVLNFTKIFDRSVINYFAKEYKEGKTPNPCIACNRYIKFDKMLKSAMQLGFDYIATGHYAKIEETQNGRFLLKRGSVAKDQSYVLYSMTQWQLSHTLFPIADYTKEEIRTIAKKANLSVAHKADSQEICFVEDKNYVAFLQKYKNLKPIPGQIIDTEGHVLGTHKGIIYYTIGQRKGLGLSLPEAMYVIKIDAKKNQIILGKEGRQYASKFSAKDLNWIAFDSLEKPMNVFAKIRYQAKLEKAKIIPENETSILVSFETPQRAITQGQAVVFYKDDLVLGGGIVK